MEPGWALWAAVGGVLERGAGELREEIVTNARSQQKNWGRKNSSEDVPFQTGERMHRMRQGPEPQSRRRGVLVGLPGADDIWETLIPGYQGRMVNSSGFAIEVRQTLLTLFSAFRCTLASDCTPHLSSRSLLPGFSSDTGRSLWSLSVSTLCGLSSVPMIST